MSTREILQQVLDIMDEIHNVVDNINWRDYSEVRTKILITRKTDDLKHILGEIPDDDLLSSEEASNFFEKILDKITRILGSLPQDKMPMQWYELELWRLRYASMYALQWGHAGELQVAGTAHALANVLMGIQTMDVQNLIVDWEHPEFEKRRKLILNYLSSAFLFFFSLCTSLNLIFKHDLEHWLSEGIKASEQYLKYMDIFWDVPKNIKLQKKKFRNVRDPNYSPYYATFAGIDYILSFLLDLQRYFFKENVNIDLRKEFIDISDPEKYFDSLHKLLEKAEYYVSDFKKHVQEGFFDINEDPLNDSDVKETIYELEVTRIWVKGLHALYQSVMKDEQTELPILEQEVIPELFKYIDKESHLFEKDDFVNSQMADAINSVLPEVILFAGVDALRAKKAENILKIDRDYSFFFEADGMKRYPTLNGLYTTFKITLDLENGIFDNLENYAEKLVILSDYTPFEPRNSFSYYLLGNMILLILGKLSKDAFLEKIKNKFEDLLPSFSHSLISEIEIYLFNLKLAFNGEFTSFNMKRLLTPQYFDPYSIFIPEIGKLAEAKNFGKIIYLPFNLQSDYLADIETQMIEQFDKLIEKKETSVEQSDTHSD
jgi:hypothetical protein